MKPPPPIPHEKGSVTPRTAAAVTAASTALPPRRSVSIAAWSRAVDVAAAPPVPTDVGGPIGAGSAAATIPTATAAITVSATTMDANLFLECQPPSRLRL